MKTSLSLIWRDLVERARTRNSPDLNQERLQVAALLVDRYGFERVFRRAGVLDAAMNRVASEVYPQVQRGRSHDDFSL